ncbi:hypothetical protein RRG08_001585 [Elysia crispata]|uniref:Uncharacterized protein n=1 Tax=Elysia crispata TaxID=231223 RepID=A0AAE1DZY7_9GAST|nr:hypothetical protein RRG08_001585 [Elysia crispata]
MLTSTQMGSGTEYIFMCVLSTSTSEYHIPAGSSDEIFCACAVSSWRSLQALVIDYVCVESGHLSPPEFPGQADSWVQYEDPRPVCVLSIAPNIKNPDSLCTVDCPQYEDSRRPQYKESRQFVYCLLPPYKDTRPVCVLSVLQTSKSASTMAASAGYTLYVPGKSNPCVSTEKLSDGNHAIFLHLGSTALEKDRTLVAVNDIRRKRNVKRRQLN